jgi:asparaginyl-tRNA synthetase
MRRFIVVVLGLERLMLYLTGMKNIRDVIPSPRTPGSAEF